LERYLGEHPPLHLMIEAFLVSRARSTDGRFRGTGGASRRPAPVDKGRGTMEDLARMLGAVIPPKKI
jgi:hypothetical protein